MRKTLCTLLVALAMAGSVNSFCNTADNTKNRIVKKIEKKGDITTQKKEMYNHNNNLYYSIYKSYKKGKLISSRIEYYHYIGKQLTSVNIQERKYDENGWRTRKIASYNTLGDILNQTVDIWNNKNQKVEHIYLWRDPGDNIHTCTKIFSYNKRGLCISKLNREFTETKKDKIIINNITITKDKYDKRYNWLGRTVEIDKNGDGKIDEITKMPGK